MSTDKVLKCNPTSNKESCMCQSNICYISPKMNYFIYSFYIISWVWYISLLYTLYVHTHSECIPNFDIGSGHYQKMLTKYLYGYIYRAGMKAFVMFHPHRLDCGVFSLTDWILTSTTLMIHNTFYYEWDYMLMQKSENKWTWQEGHLCTCMHNMQRDDPAY